MAEQRVEFDQGYRSADTSLAARVPADGDHLSSSTMADVLDPVTHKTNERSTDTVAAIRRWLRT
ncbi:hypothetical protein ACIBL6_15710 [Streptomyces sp. NPDC050400]|uniref:hypothetical protein n=1 Tax=Streptomyces sp. NPDC050400 TaxID=3365610 RepID=UPI00379574B1